MHAHHAFRFRISQQELSYFQHCNQPHNQHHLFEEDETYGGMVRPFDALDDERVVAAWQQLLRHLYANG